MISARRTPHPWEPNGAPVDRYTLAHVASGAVLGFLGVPWWAAVPAGIAFEAGEDRLKDLPGAAFPDPSHDSKANALGDLAAYVFGFACATAWRN